MGSALVSASGMPQYQCSAGWAERYTRWFAGCSLQWLCNGAWGWFAAFGYGGACGCSSCSDVAFVCFGKAQNWRVLCIGVTAQQPPCRCLQSTLWAVGSRPGLLGSWVMELTVTWMRLSRSSLKGWSSGASPVESKRWCAQPVTCSAVLSWPFPVVLRQTSRVEHLKGLGAGAGRTFNGRLPERGICREISSACGEVDLDRSCGHSREVHIVCRSGRSLLTSGSAGLTTLRRNGQVRRGTSRWLAACGKAAILLSL